MMQTAFAINKIFKQLKLDVATIISSGMLELYAAGLTSEEETRSVEQWLKLYSEVANELSAIAANVEAYAQIFAILPAPFLKQKIWGRIGIKYNDSVQPLFSAGNLFRRNLQGVSAYWRLAAAASIALLIGSTVSDFVMYQKYTAADKALTSTRQTLAVLEQKEKDIEDNLGVVQSRYSVPVALKGLEVAPEAGAKIFWMKNTGEVFIDAANLPAAPAGKQYQLWGIVDGKPVDGGMLLKNRQGNIFRMQKMKSFGKAEAFAITLEPEKGSPTPQGPMFVMGKM